jgi:hypothetical protein
MGSTHELAYLRVLTPEITTGGLGEIDDSLRDLPAVDGVGVGPGDETQSGGHVRAGPDLTHPGSRPTRGQEIEEGVEGRSGETRMDLFHLPAPMPDRNRRNGMAFFCVTDSRLEQPGEGKGPRSDDGGHARLPGSRAP